jgi:hypothetical protein
MKKDGRRVRRQREEVEAFLNMQGDLKWVLEHEQKPDFVDAEKFEWLLKNYFSIEEVSDAFGCSLKTIQRWVDSGRLSPIEVIGIRMFEKSEILDLAYE